MYYPSRLTAFLVVLSLATVLLTDLISPLFKRHTNSIPNTPRNMVYIQQYTDEAGELLSLLSLINEKTGITHIELAALHINEDPRQIHLNDVNPNSSYWDKTWSEVATVQENGVKVLFMLGGANDGTYRLLCNRNGTINYTYYTPLKETIAYHQIDGIDLDIEIGVNINCPLSLLKQFDSDFGPDFILTMAPTAMGLQAVGYSFSGFNYTALDQQATSTTRPNGKLVNWYNCQFYAKWGDAGGTKDYESIINNGFDPSRVVLGILHNSIDGEGWYNITTYISTIKSLMSMYSNFGGVIVWEYATIGSAEPSYIAPWQWVKAIGTALDLVS